MKYLIVASLVFVSTAVIADGVAIPNTFVSGQAAVAADVNENFAAVANGVNANTAAVNGLTSDVAINTIAIAAITAKSLRVVDGSGTDIGAVLNAPLQTIDVFTDEGYSVIQVSAATGGIQVYGRQALFYKSPDCTGTAYTTASNGSVFEEYTGVNRYYVPRNTQAALFTMKSKTAYDSGACELYLGGDDYYWAALSNDPAITGVPNTNYVTPLNIVLK